MEDLVKLINYIDDKYEELSNNWAASEFYIKMNMRMLVKDFILDSKYLNYVFKYRSFINSFAVDIANDLNNLNLSNLVKSRVKVLNSIQYKIENYNENHENGNVPLNKCLNDLFGIRMISNIDLDFEEIKRVIESKFPKLRCIIAERGDYYALHIYFKRGNRYRFRWELQVWNKSDEIVNDNSHAKYKQGYTKWENEVKEDLDNG